MRFVRCARAQQCTVPEEGTNSVWRRNARPDKVTSERDAVGRLASRPKEMRSTDSFRVWICMLPPLHYTRSDASVRVPSAENLELQRKQEIHEIEERKNDHIFELMEKHARAFRWGNGHPSHRPLTDHRPPGRSGS